MTPSGSLPPFVPNEWAIPMLKVVIDAAPVTARSEDLNLDGMYLLHHNSEKLISAFVNNGYVHEKDTGGNQWIRSKVEPQCGLALCPADDEPECMVWWFYDHRQDAAGG